MNFQIVVWLIFLAIIKDFSGAQRFTLGAGQLTAKEESCVKIKCTVDERVDVVGANWFWIKNALWNDTILTGTYIYSTDNAVYPVSPDLAGRVKYIGSPTSDWRIYSSTRQECSILICNLNKSDSGDYYFRYIGKKEKEKWITKSQRLTVTENPCPITFEKPPVVKESGWITLTCSTSSSCPSKPQIRGLTQRASTHQKSTTSSFSVSWQDDKKEFSCQTQYNKDHYLFRNISLTVEYAPKDTLAEISPKNIVEGNSVTLTCSAKGNPVPTFSWFKNDEAVEATQGVLNIVSIGESHNGDYCCKATNILETKTSNLVIINVTYLPEVEVTSLASEVKQGDKMSLTCKVTRSNPQPNICSWFKNGIAINHWTCLYVVERINPEYSGIYTCEATNSVGTGRSKSLQIKVKYGPRKANISIIKSDTKGDSLVVVGKTLVFQCTADANPAPTTYSWYRYKNNKPIDLSPWRFNRTNTNQLVLDRVQRADEACYICDAVNIINSGQASDPKCIQVLYAPVNPILTMTDEVIEGQLITIACTVESFPASKLTLTRRSTNQSSGWSFIPVNDGNTLRHTFNPTSSHTGFYTCSATNREGSTESKQKMLVVKYRPKHVTVEAEPDLEVNENKSLTLRCSAQSHPPVTSFTWMKMTDGKSGIIWTNQTIPLKSVGVFDSGLYRCSARNEIGIGDSPQAEVKVKYAPKQTNITTAAEQQRPDGKRSVTLSCSSHSYPPVTQYSWYKLNAEKGDVNVYGRQNYTVYSDQPGVYYCIAKNEINQRSSDRVHLFERGFTKTRIIILSLFTLLIIFLIVFVYRHKRKKSTQQGTTNTCFLGWWNGVRTRNLMNETSVAEASRSRDDLWPDQPLRLNAQRCQPVCPDSPAASNINSVYSTVNLPSGKQGPSAQKPIRQQGGHTEDDSLNYASLHFENKQKNKRAKAEEDVYSKVSKQTPPKKNEERLEDYENLGTARTAVRPKPSTYDTANSEDEYEINYSQVIFKAKRAGRDSSSSDEEETQYSHIKT
ncbi:B-cell receptor CD22-like [Cottoperca gobio]|uniref:B-cell receptor CD22 n=1 Tax=Cottoperca gobio TaxID=56716 RepID=A0A6J2RFY7_COTGO|nr:B-cell receptor CD22-like [Cottoperca gobio]XP_029308333.1 B-cell receptor CD22-like [Cottoperca gobio]